VLVDLPTYIKQIHKFKKESNKYFEGVKKQQKTQYKLSTVLLYFTYFL